MLKKFKKIEEQLARNLRKNICLNETTLINFTNMSREEIMMVLKWRNNTNVRKWMYRDDPITLQEHTNFIESLKIDKKNFYYIVKEKDKYLGVISLTRINPKHRNGYLGLYSNPEEKIARAGVILGKTLLALAFDVAKLHTLKLEVIEDNERAISLYKKLGFVEEGKLREFVFRDGRWKDVIIMGITEEEYRRIHHAEDTKNW